MLRLGLGPRSAIPAALTDCRTNINEADSLIYGDIDTSDLSGDASGTEFLFVLDSGGMRASVRQAAGGVSLPMSVQRLRHSPDGDSVTGWYTYGGRNLISLMFRLSCERLTGTERFLILPWRNEPEKTGTKPISLPRIPRPFKW